MIHTFTKCFTLTWLVLFSVNSYASTYNCTEIFNSVKATLIISGIDDEALSIQSEDKGIDYKNASLDEAEESTYFYIEKNITIVVSTDLFVIGRGDVTLEEDGEPIDSGSFYCISEEL